MILPFLSGFFFRWFQLGTLVAPYIVDLGGSSNPGLPPAIFGVSMLVASVAFLFLPDTKNQPLRQKAEDMRSDDPTIAKSLCSRNT